MDTFTPGHSTGKGNGPAPGGRDKGSLAGSFARRIGMPPLAPKQMLQQALKRFGYEIRKTRAAGPGPSELPLIDVLDLVAREHLRGTSDPFLVQVGAHDGKSEDPVHDLLQNHRPRGLLVEPQPHAFRRLVDNYRDQPQLAFENCLIGRSDEDTPFYVVRESAEDLPFWLHQSASLDRAVVSNALRFFREVKGVTSIPEDYESLIDVVSVPSLTWRTLLQKHQITKIDVLVIDTMGFDFELIKLLPFELVKPSIIHFEHSLLSAHDQRACLEYLAQHGYSLAKVAVDTIACLNGKTRRWQLESW